MLSQSVVSAHLWDVCQPSDIVWARWEALAEAWLTLRRGSSANG